MKEPLVYEISAPGRCGVEMPEPDADKAIAALHDKILDGRAIHVHEGRQKVHGLASPEQVLRNTTSKYPMVLT